MRRPPLLALAGACTGALVLTGCGDAPDSPTAADPTKVNVSAAVYPLAYLTERVGGEHVAVTNLTKPGAEPHDVELTPEQVGTITDSKLVVYVKGLQPAVDQAVGQQAKDTSYDVSPAARLQPPVEGATVTASDGSSAARDHAGESAEEHAAHAGESGPAGETARTGDAEHDHGGMDPHFWLDPTRYADVATALAVKLGEADPEHQGDYTTNAQALVSELTALDKEYATGLKTCASRNLVTAHSAFGYLATRYRFSQVGIAGLNADTEPTPSALAGITAYVRDHQVRTIYTETLLNPELARTVASETGAQVAVLDPLEGLTDDSPGPKPADYMTVMRANLETLKTGQQCQ